MSCEKRSVCVFLVVIVLSFGEEIVLQEFEGERERRKCCHSGLFA